MRSGEYFTISKCMMVAIEYYFNMGLVICGLSSLGWAVIIVVVSFLVEHEVLFYLAAGYNRSVISARPGL